MKLSLFSAVPLCFSIAVPVLAATDAIETAPTAPQAQDGRSGFYSKFNILGFGIEQQTKESALNPGNRLKIPRYQAEIDFRPDFNLNLTQFEFGLKPRLQYARSRVEVGSGEHIDDTSHHAFINEGFARYRITDRLLANVGRENLQWGPSALLSPSNPFNANNGRNNPNLEQPGLDYARLVAIPNSAVTVSLIANTGAGRLEMNQPFDKTYAVKMDYTGDGHYFSVLSSHRRNASNRLGFFGGWNASDALLMYAEGSAAKKTDNAPLARSDYQALAGAAYTLEAGPTISFEYFHNNQGCTLSRVDLCLAQQTVAIDPRRPFLRRRYALAQYVDTKIRGNMNLAVRVIKNLDDSSGQLVVNLEYELGQHWQLYFVPTVFSGGRDSEFGSLLRHSTFVGASYTF